MRSSGLYDNRRAVVVFQSGGTHWLSSLLNPGFRHCSVAVESGDYWVHVDPNPDGIRFKVVALSSFDIAGHFKECGYTTVKLIAPGDCVGAPFAISNCVGVVKAVLGIRKPFIITPYQLHKHLGRNK